jgi:ABC-type cobalt transport system substrate-binding protein
MVLFVIILIVAAFVTGYFVGSNNPSKSVIQKIKNKL